MPLVTERIKFLVDVDTSEFVKQFRQMADTVADFRNTGDRIPLMDAVGDTAILKARQYWDILKDTAKAASDLNEALNFSQKVFLEAAPGIEKFAESAEKIGFSKTSALNAAASLGVFGKTAGLAGDDLIDFTEELVTLAADMASVKNTTPEDAIIALGAALRSEYEPLRKYGVVLNDVQLRQRAFALGIYDGTGALNSSQRILAARAEVMDQLSFAMGDFIDTQDEFANQQRTLNANVANLQASIGTGLLPVFKGLTSAAQGTVNILNALPDGLKEGAGAAAVLAVGLLGAVGAALKLRAALAALQGFAASGSAFSGILAALTGPVGLTAGLAAVVIAVPALLTAFANARIESERLKTALEELAETGIDPANEGLQLSTWFDNELKKTVPIIGEFGGTIATVNQPLSWAVDRMLGDVDSLRIGVEQSLDLSNEAFDEWARNLKRIIRDSGESPAAIKAFDEFIEKLRAVRPELQRNATVAKEAQQQLALQASEAEKALEREEDQLKKTYETAARAKNDAVKNLREAQADLAEARTNAQADFAEATERYNRSIEDQTRAIERQRYSVEESYRAIEEAQQAVQEALRGEEEARRGIQDALDRQVDAQQSLRDAQVSAAEAQEEYDTAVRDTTNAMRGYGAASREAADALEGVDDAQRQLRGSSLAVEDSAIALADAQAQLARLRRFYGDTSSPAALRRLSDAERAVARAQLEHEEATDNLESSTKDLNEAQKEYDQIVNGFPADSDRVKKALEDQEAASRRLESATRDVKSANERVIESQRSVDSAYRNSESASRQVEDARRRVEQQTRSASWASDDLRRAEWELATYRVSGQPTAASEGVRSAEQGVADARARLAAETMAVYAAEQALAAFRRANPPEFVGARPGPYSPPQFMNGYAPAGSFGGTTTVRVDINGAVIDSSAARKISDALTNYWRTTGRIPMYGGFW
jgi:hypothetical protein